MTSWTPKLYNSLISGFVYPITFGGLHYSKLILNPEHYTHITLMKLYGLFFVPNSSFWSAVDMSGIYKTVIGVVMFIYMYLHVIKA